MLEHKQYEPLLEVKEVVDMLNKISIFAGLNDKQLYKLFRLLETVHYKKNETVFEQDTEPSHIYIIHSGAIKLIVSEDDTPYELVVFEQGHCFGESSVIGIQPHTATAIATEDTELIVLSRTALMSIYKNDIEMFCLLLLNISREVCRRLHGSSDTLMLYMKQKAGQ